jgi:hypothetical protein
MCKVNTDPDFNEPWKHQADGLWYSSELKRAQTQADAGGWAGGVPMWQKALDDWKQRDAQMHGGQG